MGLQMKNKLKKYLKIEEAAKGSSFMGIFVGIFAAFGGILFGYDTGTISGILVMKYVTKEFPANEEYFTSQERSLIVSILSAGTFFGALFASFLSDYLGRRWSLIIATFIIFNLGVTLQTAATNIPLLCAGRAIAGFGVGIVSVVVPLYQSEAAPKWIRGAIVSSYQLAVTFGLLLAAIVNQATHNRNDSGSYRIPIAVQLLWSLILGLGMCILPDTPRFWIYKGNDEKAKDSLRILRKLQIDDPYLVEEYNDIKASYEFECSVGKVSWMDVISTQNKQLKRLFTGITLMALTQLSGCNFVFYFGTSFFKDAGIQNEFTISLATNIVNVGMTIPSILLIEFLGRRSMLLCGAAGMVISQFIIAIVGTVSSEDSKSANNVLIAFVCIFIGYYASTFGPIGWVVVGEIFPLKTRAKSVALSLSSNWIWNWGIAYATPYMVDEGPGNASLGSKVFFIWVVLTYFLFSLLIFLFMKQKDYLWSRLMNCTRMLTLLGNPVNLFHQLMSLDTIKLNYFCTQKKGDKVEEVEKADSDVNV